MKPIHIDISGIDDTLDVLNDRIKSMPVDAKVLVEKLTDIGKSVAQGYYRTAWYDGTNDVVVTAEVKSRSKHVQRGDVVARGNAVTFIEYGSGVHYVLVHPWASQEGMVRGGFGYGLGNFDSWRYKGDPGTHGEIINEGKHAGEVLTHGNPPARAMYFADKSMRNNVFRLAKGVFRR